MIKNNYYLDPAKMGKKQLKEYNRQLDKLITVREAINKTAELEKQIKQNHQVINALIVANILSSAPYRFGKKRIENVILELFGIAEGLADKHIEPHMIYTQAAKTGIKIAREGDTYKIDFRGNK